MRLTLEPTLENRPSMSDLPGLPHIKIELATPHDDLTATDFVELFERLMVAAGFDQHTVDECFCDPANCSEFQDTSG